MVLVRLLLGAVFTLICVFALFLASVPFGGLALPEVTVLLVVAGLGYALYAVSTIRKWRNSSGDKEA